MMNGDATPTVTFNPDAARATMQRIGERLQRIDPYLAVADRDIGTWTPDDITCLLAFLSNDADMRERIMALLAADPLYTAIVTRVLLQMGYALALADRAEGVA